MAEMDRLKASFLKIVLGVVSRTDYHALYASTVVSQNASGTLEVRPDVAKVPPLSKVPIRVGIPGVTVKLNAGARVLLGFENGDPKRPYASLWDTATLIELKINAGSIGLAKADHTHSVGFTADVSGAPTLFDVTSSAPSTTTTLIKVP